MFHMPKCAFNFGSSAALLIINIGGSASSAKFIPNIHETLLLDLFVGCLGSGMASLKGTAAGLPPLPFLDPSNENPSCQIE